ncbi:MAG: hypothetical protein V2A73_09505 [Pseudomonadota bacterium]
MQLNLSFLEIPGPSPQLWASLDEKERRDVINKLSRLIASASLASEPSEAVDVNKESDDD